MERCHRKRSPGWWNIIVLLTLIIVPAGHSRAAAEKPRIELKASCVRQVVHDLNGQKTVELVPATESASGDTLVYSTEYHNSGKSSAEKVTVVSPIPANTVYVDGSAVGENSKILFSLNQGLSYQEPPLMLKTRNKQGKEVTLPAPPEMITHIKWIVQIPVKPAGQGTTTYKVVVK